MICYTRRIYHENVRRDAENTKIFLALFRAFVIDLFWFSPSPLPARRLPRRLVPVVIMSSYHRIELVLGTYEVVNIYLAAFSNLTVAFYFYSLSRYYKMIFYHYRHGAARQNRPA